MKVDNSNHNKNKNQMKKLFQLKDERGGLVTGPIMALKREEAAIREFHAILAMGEKSTPGSYPKDFLLLDLGEQDEETGVITARQIPQIVASGEEWLEQQERDAALTRLKNGGNNGPQ